ncbi:MAG: 4-alpha-glucanotransferase [Xanthobacteraceae bacterium]
MNLNVERAALCGIEPHYVDGLGRLRTAEPEVVSRLLGAMAWDDDFAPRMLPRTIIVRAPPDRVVRLAAADGLALRWEIFSQQKVAEGCDISPLLTLPQALSLGAFRLLVTATTPAGAVTEEASLIVCPPRAYQGGTSAPERMWALAVQLYGVRSDRNWGHGDFTDLLALVDLAADLGASGVGLNPLHALFDDRPSEPSPYFPNSRLFLNPLYIDVEAVPEFPGLRATRLEASVERFRSDSMIDYEAVAAAKMEALRLAHANFRQSGSPKRRRAFGLFRRARGALLARFACFELLRRRLGRPWWEWPPPWRRIDEEALDRFRRAEAAEVGFFEYVQWLAHEQLDRCRARARERSLAIGLYLDIAVGVRRDGFDAWCDQDAILSGMAIGAPPDALNRSGQEWGLAAFNPVALERRQFEPYRRMLQASMHFAGAIRLDHVLGLKRLFLVPDGMQADRGVYIRCPFEALLSVTVLSSVANRCIVIGEDLGTVPENFRETLADWGLWSYQVMLFERSTGGDFRALDSYRRDALVTFATHDLPTYAGWRERRDLAVKRALGMETGETEEERGAALDALRRALNQPGGEPIDFAVLARFLADAPSRLLILSMEDLLGVTDQVNLPGTTDAHPNWRQRLPVALEGLSSQAGVLSAAEVMRSAGRGQLRR